MKKLKKILVFLVLLVGCCCCFASCSCSSKVATDPTEPPTNDAPPVIQEATYYNVSVTITGGEESGTCVSSNGSNRHVSNSSPIYTFTPNRGYAIESITIDGVLYYTHLKDGYKKEPTSVTIDNIEKDYSLGVTFKHMQYNVNCTIDGEILGGTVVSSTGQNIHMGATSPTYTITPNTGYCIMSLKVDGEDLYNYMNDFVTNMEGATSQIVIEEPFELLNDDHSISVEFAKLYDINYMAVNTYYYQDYKETEEYENSPILVEDTKKLLLNGIDVVTFEGFDDYEILPLGIKHKIKLNFSENFSSYFESVLVKVSFDGGIQYSEEFNINADYQDLGYGFKYDSETKVIEFEEFNDTIVISVCGKPRVISLTLYDYDNQTTISTMNTYLFSNKDGLNDTLNWYYSLSDNYYISNLYIKANVKSVNAAGGKIYRIFLDDTMLAYGDNDELTNKIILIYSASDLKNN